MRMGFSTPSRLCTWPSSAPAGLGGKLSGPVCKKCLDLPPLGLLAAEWGPGRRKGLEPQVGQWRNRLSLQPPDHPHLPISRGNHWCVVMCCVPTGYPSTWNAVRGLREGFLHLRELELWPRTMNQIRPPAPRRGRLPHRVRPKKVPSPRLPLPRRSRALLLSGDGGRVILLPPPGLGMRRRRMTGEAGGGRRKDAAAKGAGAAAMTETTAGMIVGAAVLPTGRRGIGGSVKGTGGKETKTGRRRKKRRRPPSPSPTSFWVSRRL